MSDSFVKGARVRKPEPIAPWRPDPGAVAAAANVGMVAARIGCNAARAMFHAQGNPATLIASEGQIAGLVALAVERGLREAIDRA